MERREGTRQAILMVVEPAMLSREEYDILPASRTEEVLDYLTSHREVAAIVLELAIPGEENIGNFLAQPLNREELKRVLRDPLEQSSYSALSPASHHARCCRDMHFGTSEAMLALKSSLQTIAASDAPVLIEGEIGSGKEMLARQLHALSPWKDRPFLKLNCTAIPSERMEVELFGRERSAVGASEEKPGFFELPGGGTLLLDEIGDLNLRLQARLLQALHDQEFQRLDGNDTERSRVRVLAATQRNLLPLVAEKSFRADLYYLLNVFTLGLPSLRERPQDILELAEYFLRKHGAVEPLARFLTERLKTALMGYAWPGNIRQLENFVRKLLVLDDPDIIAAEIEGLDREGVIPRPAAHSIASGKKSTLQQIARANSEAEVAVILEALHATRWNRKQAAARLQLDYKAFLYKMKKLSIEDQVRAVPVWT